MKRGAASERRTDSKEVCWYSECLVSTFEKNRMGNQHTQEADANT